MIDDISPEQRALTFAQSHDWGRNARVTVDPGCGAPVITGLTRHHQLPSGSWSVETVTVDATMEAVREFGEY